MTSVKTALLGVSDKTGLAEFARGLAGLGVKILSTGGTAKVLREAGVEVTDVSDHTGSPEILDGRVKTLHPRIHGGILARRDEPAHMEQSAEQGIEMIDLVCVNLYPFAEVTTRGASFAEAIENIDIGGPSMLRSAAKNHNDVAVVTDPADYAGLIEELGESGTLGEATRRRLAAKAFATTAAYDGMIADYLGAAGDGGFGRTRHNQWHLVQGLRYGENPHQQAAFYRDPLLAGPSVAAARILQGKELSYNNIVDADAALGLLLEFDETVCIAVKHTNPCGVATAGTVDEAFRRARSCDPVSIFGGIVGVNRELDEDTAREMSEVFLEIVIATSFSDGARAVFDSSDRLRNVRLLEVCMDGPPATAPEMKRVAGGMLVQSRDDVVTDLVGCEVATKRRPDEAELGALDLAWKTAKHVKSNAIVLAKGGRVVGVGAGQMSRVDSARIAVARAREHGLDIEGAAVASDAFFPFRDGLDVVAEAGATAVVQPGGSVRDKEIISAADEHGMAMVMTGTRHFRH